MGPPKDEGYRVPMEAEMGVVLLLFRKWDVFLVPFLSCPVCRGCPWTAGSESWPIYVRATLSPKRPVLSPLDHEAPGDQECFKVRSLPWTTSGV